MFRPPDDHWLVLQNRWYVEIHGNVGKWSLETNARRDINIKDKFLEGLFYLSIVQVIIADKWGKERIKIGNGLGACCFTL